MIHMCQQKLSIQPFSIIQKRFYNRETITSRIMNWPKCLSFYANQIINPFLYTMYRGIRPGSRGVTVQGDPFKIQYKIYLL